MIGGTMGIVAAAWQPVSDGHCPRRQHRIMLVVATCFHIMKRFGRPVLVTALFHKNLRFVDLIH